MDVNDRLTHILADVPESPRRRRMAPLTAQSHSPAACSFAPRFANLRRAPPTGRTRPHDPVAQRQGDAGRDHRPGVSFPRVAPRRRSARAYPRRAGRAAVLRRVDRTFCRLPDFGDYLPGVAMPLVKDKIEHETANVVLPAEEELLGMHLGEPAREGRADERELPRGGLLGEGEARHRFAGLSRRPPASRDRSHFGEDLDDLFADLRPRPRAHDRDAFQPARTPVPGADKSTEFKRSR